MIVKYERSYDGITSLERNDIEKFDKIINIVGKGITINDVEDLKRGDTFVVSNLNELGFNSGENLELIKYLFNNGVKVDIQNYGVIDREKINNLELLFEYEKECMVQRIAYAKHVAKLNNNDCKGGRPRIKKDKEKLILKLLKQGSTYAEISKLAGVSTATVCRYKQKYM